MPEHIGLERRFHRFIEALIERIKSECEYIPEDYVRRVEQYGGLQAVKRFLAEPSSEDSIQLWARGRADLTVETIATDSEWAPLLSAEEESIALRRTADMSSTPTALEISEDTAETLSELSSECDDLTWGQELIDGIDVCDKMAQVDRSLQSGDAMDGGWVLAYYRKHLETCARCNEVCRNLKGGLDEFDTKALISIGKLLAMCSNSLDYGDERARQLLRNEWKEARNQGPLSDEPDVTVSDNALIHYREFSDWMRVLPSRAGQLIARTGSIIFAYEESYFAVGNPWLTWRNEGHDSASARFVRGLTDSDFLSVLMARNIARMNCDPLRRPLELPTDGDLSELNGIVAVRVTTKLSDWDDVLSQNFVRRALRIANLSLDVESNAEPVTTSRTSDLLDLNWAQVLYLGWSAAVREASNEQSKVVAPSFFPQFDDLKDSVDSIKAAQLPIIDMLERVADQLKRNNPQSAPEESLKKSIGDRIFSSLSPDARVNALAAEQILHDPHFPNPGLGAFALCAAFEHELKDGFLARFCRFLTSKGLQHFPDSELLENKRWRPRVLVNYRPKRDLTLGDIRLALDSPRLEILDFCASEGIDLPLLRQQIELVNQYRNPSAHGPSMSFPKARRIREELLGIAVGDGGVFGLLLPLST